MQPLKWFILLLLLALAGVGLTGCATPEESDNVSTRPWNAPGNWEFGVPGMPTQPGGTYR
jgi:hypothetical protein